MDTITGNIYNIIFQNENNNYIVAQLDSNEIIVGFLPPEVYSKTLELKGDWIYHQKYGHQFNIKEFNILFPNTVQEIKQLLASGLIHGVGPSLADKIIKHFGTKTLEIMNKNPERLKEINGIGAKKYKDIIESWVNHRDEAEVYINLQSLGFSNEKTHKIVALLGKSAYQNIKANPYSLCDLKIGIGFKTADQIAKKLDIGDEDPRRIRTAIIHLLKETSYNGNVFLPEPLLFSKLLKDYKIDLTENFSVYKDLLKDFLLKRIEDKIYLFELYEIEKEIEEIILSRVKSFNPPKKTEIPGITKYSEEQVEAINLSDSAEFMILTGGPGTGKTTTLKAIIELHTKKGETVFLAAPTGRAAKRITEITGHEAKTIHRLLEYNPSAEVFTRDEENPLECDLLIIDETSMMDYYLTIALLKAADKHTKIIFIGDYNQLPSIGPGNILKDLINSELIPIIKLNKIFRQSEQSTIVTNSHKIIRGETPEINNNKNSDFFFIYENNPEKIMQTITDLVKQRLPAAYNLNPLKDIQVISPMYRGHSGVDNINSILQTEMNPTPYLELPSTVRYKLNDKVIQLSNNYDKEIFNGDIGFIHSYNKQKDELNIDFSGIYVNYRSHELDQISLAYAVTVHKSQGSEYPCVVIALSDEHSVMLNRNLLYTGMTRAAKLLIITGSRNALLRCIKNDHAQKRYTSLFKSAEEI